MFTVIYKFICDGCGKEAQSELGMPNSVVRDLGYSMPRPPLPQNWKIVGPNLYCDEETVRVKVTNANKGVVMSERDFKW